MNIKSLLTGLMFSSVLMGCFDDSGILSSPPTTDTIQIGEIQIASIGVAITYDEELAASSKTTLKIAGGPPANSAVIFSDPPDNTTISVNADLNRYTVGSNVTVDIAVAVDDLALNAGSTQIMVTINP